MDRRPLKFQLHALLFQMKIGGPNENARIHFSECTEEKGGDFQMMSGKATMGSVAILCRLYFSTVPARDLM